MFRRIAFALAGLALFALGYLAGGAGINVSLAVPAAQGTCHTFPETRQTVCGRFLQYWQQNGGLRQQGYPISGEFREVSDLDGKTYTVQYFERAVFEHHPENQPPNDVLLSQLGTFRYRQKYGNNPPGTPAPPPPPSGPTATPVPQPPIHAEVSEPVTRDGVTFIVTRVDRLEDRHDVIFEVRNNTGAPLALTIRNSDQSLTSSRGTVYQLGSPYHVASVTLQNGQTYSGGTTFFTEDFTNRPEIKSLTFEIRNLPRIGTVRVSFPPLPEE